MLKMLVYTYEGLQTDVVIVISFVCFVTMLPQMLNAASDRAEMSLWAAFSDYEKY